MKDNLDKKSDFIKEKTQGASTPEN
jgi:hypothetical protein